MPPSFLIRCVRLQKEHKRHSWSSEQDHGMHGHREQARAILPLRRCLSSGADDQSTNRSVGVSGRTYYICWRRRYDSTVAWESGSGYPESRLSLSLSTYRLFGHHVFTEGAACSHDIPRPFSSLRRLDVPITGSREFWPIVAPDGSNLDRGDESVGGQKDNSLHRDSYERNSMRWSR